MEGFLPTAAICLVLLMIVVFSVRSYLKKLKSGCCGAGGDEVKRVRPADRDASHYSYARLVRIEGMHCQNCARRVENAFNSQEGFYAKVDLAKKTALVRTKVPVSDQQLKQVVRRLGYSPVAVEPPKALACWAQGRAGPFLIPFETVAQYRHRFAEKETFHLSRGACGLRMDSSAG